MVSKYNGLLEKKWTTVIRLQKKVSELPPYPARRPHPLISPDHGPGEQAVGGAEGGGGGRGHQEVSAGHRLDPQTTREV